MAYFWVRRQDSWTCYDANDYYIAFRKRDLAGDYGNWNAFDSLCAGSWEIATKIKLKPGEGPIKVKIERI
jgi:hypothetical protein